MKVSVDAKLCGNHCGIETGPLMVRVLYALIAAVIVLFGTEIAHYVQATDFGNSDDFAVAWEGYHPQCVPATGDVLDMVCPLKGYNSVHLQCWTASCSFRDPNDVPLTEALRKAHLHQIRMDEQTSFAVEPPMTATEYANILFPENAEDLSQPPQTMQAALEIIYKRDMRARRDLLKRLQTP